MTIKEYIDIRGWQMDVKALRKYQSVCVTFLADKVECETVFDMCGACTNDGRDELVELFDDFCNKKIINSYTVSSITVIRSADKLEHLNPAYKAKLVENSNKERLTYEKLRKMCHLCSGIFPEQGDIKCELIISNDSGLKESTFITQDSMHAALVKEIMKANDLRSLCEDKLLQID